MENLSDAQLKKLYIDQSMSVAQIAVYYGCSQNKINYWLARYGVPKRSISDALYRSHNPNGDPFSIKSVSTLEDAMLMGMGLGLYWGEGNKRNPSAIRLGNTDPFLIRKFVRFLRDMLGVPISKLRFGLQIFSDMKAADALRFWIKHLSSFGVRSDQFQRPIITPARSLGTYRQKTRWGVLTVYCSNIKLKRMIDQMLAKEAV